MNVLRPTKTKQTKGYSTKHKGYDHSGRTPLDGWVFDDGVYASFSGVVVQSVDLYDNSWSTTGSLTTKDYGNYIKIKGDSLFQLSAHLQKGSVLSVGTVVKRGDKIGIIGNTGNSTGRHCHTEYRFLNGINTPVEFDLDYQPGTVEDIRLKLLDEAGIKDEPTTREVIERYKKYPQLQNDKDNLQKEYDLYKESRIKIDEEIKEERSIREEYIKKLEAASKDFTRELAVLLGTPQDKEKILVELRAVIAKAEKVEKIIDDRPVGKDNFIQSIIKLLKEFFGRADKAVNN